MELKLECGCGQKYAFDVEPVDGVMPVPVGCPSCGVDGTASANQQIALATSASPPAVPSSPKMSMQRHVAEVKPAAVQAAPSAITPPSVPVRVSVGKNLPTTSPTKGESNPNLPMGILGAFLGAVVGSGLAYWFTSATGIRLPFIGLVTGFLAAMGGRLLCRGTDGKLGVAAAVFAFIGVSGTLVATDMFSIFSIISLFVSVSVAYRTASG